MWYIYILGGMGVELFLTRLMRYQHLRTYLCGGALLFFYEEDTKHMHISIFLQLQFICLASDTLYFNPKKITYCSNGIFSN